MTEKEIVRYRLWVKHLEKSNPDLTVEEIALKAHAKALSAEELPEDPKPFDIDVPWYAKNPASRGIVRAVAGPRVLALVAVLFAAYVGVCATGLLPDGACIHVGEIGTTLIEVGLLLEGTPPTATPLMTPTP